MQDCGVDPLHTALNPSFQSKRCQITIQHKMQKDSVSTVTCFISINPDEVFLKKRECDFECVGVRTFHLSHVQGLAQLLQQVRSGSVLLVLFAIVVLLSHAGVVEPGVA